MSTDQTELRASDCTPGPVAIHGVNIYRFACDDTPPVAFVSFTNRRHADAALVAQAFNVAHETGRTPRQLADDRAALLEALADAEAVVSNLAQDLEAIAGAPVMRGIRRVRDSARAAIARATGGDS